MLDALENELCIDIHEKSQKKIIQVFELAKAIQLPVVDRNKVVGILDLFVFLDNINKNWSSPFLCVNSFGYTVRFR